MTNVIHMPSNTTRLQWLRSRHEQCWKLHEKYGDRFTARGQAHDLSFAQQWMDKALKFGREIDIIEHQKTKVVFC